MATIINVSEKDLLRGKIVTPAWYRVLVNKVNDRLSKDGNSTNYWVDGEILFNADNGDKTFAGVPTPQGWLFNSGAISFAEGFVVSCGGEWKLGRIDLGAAEGQQLDVFIENQLWEGRMQNKINHQYRKPRV